MSQSVINWIGADGRLIRFAYSNRRAAYLGETLTTGATISAIDAEERLVTLEIFVKNEALEVTSPGSATVVLT